jgi:hypothetical protein
MFTDTSKSKAVIAYGPQPVPSKFQSYKLIFLSSLLMLFSHILVSQTSAFEEIYISKYYLFLSSESHVHSYNVHFTNIPKKHVTFNL